MLFELSRLRYTIPLLLILFALAIAQETAKSRSPNQDSSRMASVAQWNALIPKINAELARNKDICEHSANWPIRVVDAVDLTGVGEPVALLDWCNGGAYTDSLILMRLEAGRPVMARFRLRDGKYGDVEFLSGSSVQHSCSAELHPEKHAVYNIELEMDGSSESSVAEVVRARVDVYVWNRKTKTFDWDRALSEQESRVRTGKKPSKSRLINVFVSRPNIVVHGAFLSEVQVWEIPTGTRITEAEPTLLGIAKRMTPAGTTEEWFFAIPPCSTERILATAIYVSGFDDHGRNIGSKSLPFSGATAIDEALCGKQH